MPDEVFVRHYFYQKDGYNYYIVSERYAAFESRNLMIYKEKPIFLFLKNRERVSDLELAKNKIDMSEVYKGFNKISQY